MKNTQEDGAIRLVNRVYEPREYTQSGSGAKTPKEPPQRWQVHRP